MHFTSDVKEALNHKYSDIADEMIKDGKDIVSLCVGEPDMKVPTYIIDGIYKAMLEGKTHYSNSQGIKELRDAIAQDVNNIYGCEYIGDEVMIAPGVKPASYFALSCLLEPKDEVVIISPYYLSYPSNIALAEPETVIKVVDLNDDLSLNIEKLDEAVNDKTKCILVNSPNNPAGSMFSKNEVESICKIALKHPNTYIISDEVYDRLVYKGEVHHSFLSEKNIKERLVLAKA